MYIHWHNCNIHIITSQIDKSTFHMECFQTDSRNHEKESCDFWFNTVASGIATCYILCDEL